MADHRCGPSVSLQEQGGERKRIPPEKRLDLWLVDGGLRSACPPYQLTSSRWWRRRCRI
jgi:hypothetical protein